MNDSQSHYLEPLFRKLDQFFDIKEQQKDLLIEFAQEMEPHDTGDDLLSQGQKYGRCGILADGWAIQYKTLSNGSRQIIDFLLPGTFFGLQASVFDTSDHSVTTLTKAKVYKFTPADLNKLVHTDPMLGMAIFWDRTLEEAILMERLLTLGQRSARARLAHVMIEAWYRLDIRGLDSVQRLPFPLRQAVLAELLGLSTVHVNRSLKAMKRDGEIDYDRSTVSLLDLEALVKSADFDAEYLHASRPRSQASERLSQFMA